MKRKLVFLFLILGAIYIFPHNINAKNSELMTKDDFKIFVQMINKRFDDVNKRFDDVNKRFDFMLWVMGIGFLALAVFSLFLYKLTHNEMDRRFEQVDKRFEEVDKRFEEVMSVLLLLVKAHEKEIGSEVIDVTLGKKKMVDISKDIEQDFKLKVVEREKDKFKDYLKDPEIMAIIINEMKKRNFVIKERDSA